MVTVKQKSELTGSRYRGLVICTSILIKSQRISPTSPECLSSIASWPFGLGQRWGCLLPTIFFHCSTLTTLYLFVLTHSSYRLPHLFSFSSAATFWRTASGILSRTRDAVVLKFCDTITLTFPQTDLHIMLILEKYQNPCHDPNNYCMSDLQFTIVTRPLFNRWWVQLPC